MTRSIHELVDWVEDIKLKNGSSAAALYIIKNHQVILDYYSGTHSHLNQAKPITSSSQFNIASARKSYLGLAVAYALHDGLIKNLDSKVSTYFEDCEKELFRDTTIRHLVTHSHGLNRRKDGSLFREFNPGESWAYHNVGDGMMAELINRLYQKSFPQLLKERVFDPMGLKETGWRTKTNDHLVKVIADVNDPPLQGLGEEEDGTEKNLFVSARDLAKWGELHLNKGVVKGKQIVPREVIELATTIQNPDYSDPQLPRNGLFWYVQDIPRDRSEIGERVPSGAFQILGVTGPTILVIPEYNVVVAKMYNKRNNYGGDQYLYYLREFSNKVSDVFSSW